MQKIKALTFCWRDKKGWKRRVSIPVPRACEARALPIELRSLRWSSSQSNSPYLCQSPAGPCSGPLAQAARFSTWHRAPVCPLSACYSCSSGFCCRTPDVQVLSEFWAQAHQLEIYKSFLLISTNSSLIFRRVFYLFPANLGFWVSALPMIIGLFIFDHGHWPSSYAMIALSVTVWLQLLASAFLQLCPQFLRNRGWMF